MFYLGIALATIGALLLIVGIVLAFAFDEVYLSIFFFGFVPILMSVYCLRPEPKTEDVFNGKANYVLYTTYGVTDDGDTISCEKTYKIEWKDDWKNGRKRY